VCVSRFKWVRDSSLYEDSQPAWLTSWDSWTCLEIAGAGGLEVLKHVREQGCQWHALTCWKAAEAGRLDVLKWARANDCEWDWRSCWGPAKGGHLEII